MAIELPGGPIDPGLAGGLACVACGTLPEEGDTIACVQLLKHGEVGLHAQKYLLAHYFCWACLLANGLSQVRLAVARTLSVTCRQAEAGLVVAWC